MLLKALSDLLYSIPKKLLVLLAEYSAMLTIQPTLMSFLVSILFRLELVCIINLDQTCVRCLIRPQPYGVFFWCQRPAVSNTRRQFGPVSSTLRGRSPGLKDISWSQTMVFNLLIFNFIFNFQEV